MNWEEACRILGVSEEATPAEIKEQYLYKAQLLHPDKTINTPDKVRQKAEEELAQTNESYKFLSDFKNDPRNPPKLEIAPLAVRFTEVALNQKKSTTIEVKSAGGPFTNCWIDNSPAPWLAVTGVKAATSEALPLLVTIEASGLPGIIQTERCQILVKLRNEKTGLEDVGAINVEIVPAFLAAKLKVKKRKIKFENVPLGTIRSYVLEIGNAGPDILHGYVVTNSPWLSASQSEIILPKRAVGRCTLNVDTENLPPGFREIGYVNIYTNGGEAAVPIEIAVAKILQSRPVPANYGSQGRGRAYGGMQAAAPAPRPVGSGGGSFWLLRFVLIFVVTFGLGLVCIIFFTGNRPDGPDIPSIVGWGAITLVASMLIATIRK